MSRCVRVVPGVLRSVPGCLMHRKVFPQVQVSFWSLQLTNLLDDGLLVLETPLEKVANDVDGLLVN